MTESKYDSQIVILGAGPSGLLTAYFLKKKGYKHVLILEKEGHVGGLCRTITSEGKSFDLGANYVTPAYKITLKVAREVRAKVYSEKPFTAMMMPDKNCPKGKVKYATIFSAVKARTPLMKFLLSNLRFIWIRYKLSKIVDLPTFDGIENYDNGSLCVPFADWLKENDLECLSKAFLIPITQMGYGYLNETPAVYALKFMTLATFIPMMIKEIPFIGDLYWWPKRFTLGYQRMWQSVAARLDVRLDTEVINIDRSNGKIVLKIITKKENLDGVGGFSQDIEAEHLILACPLKSFTKTSKEKVMELSNEEQDLFSKIDEISYCMTTRNLKGDELLNHGNAPLASIFPVPQLDDNNLAATYGVAKQWKDNPLVQFYTSTYSKNSDEDVQEVVRKNVDTLIEQMNGVPIAGQKWNSFNRWDYFQHVKTDVMMGEKNADNTRKPGWYTRLEKLQGEQNTYYVGGATNFELIEPIASYTQNLVREKF